MRKFFLLIASFSSIAATAQTDSTQPEVKYKTMVAKVKTMDNRFVKGIVYPAPTTDQLILSQLTKTKMSSTPAGETINIPAENIQSFTVKRKNSVLKRTLLGFAIGAVTGVVVGLASGDDPVMAYPDPSDDFLGLGTLAVGINNAFAMTAGEKAVAGGLGLGVTGAIVGTVVGALVKKKFIIDGKKEKFRDLQAELMAKLVKK